MKLTMLDAPLMDKAELINEINYQVAANSLDYADSYRATPTTKSIREHEAKVSCCGVWEGKHTCKSGVEYFIGCNYGH